VGTCDKADCFNADDLLGRRVLKKEVVQVTDEFNRLWLGLVLAVRELVLLPINGLLDVIGRKPHNGIMFGSRNEYVGMVGRIILQ
jgi:hypothetical protein